MPRIVMGFLLGSDNLRSGRMATRSILTAALCLGATSAAAQSPNAQRHCKARAPACAGRTMRLRFGPVRE